MKKTLVLVGLLLVGYTQAMEYMPVEIKAYIMGHIAQVKTAAEALNAIKTLETLAQVNHEFNNLYKDELVKISLANQLQAQLGGELEDWLAILGAPKALEKFKENKDVRLLKTAQDKNDDAIKVLAYLRAGADVNAKDKDSLTALMHAAYNNNKDIVALLAAAGADVSAQDKCGSTALMYAENNKDFRGMTQINVNTQNKFKERALIAELLIAARSDVSAKDKYGQTTLIAAARNNNKELVELLVKHGADVNAKDCFGQSALTSARDQELIELLLKAGANVHAQDRLGQTALRQAILNNKKELVELLLKAGANVNAQDNDGYTALMLAATNNKKELVELLLKAGADAHAQNKDGQTALMIANSWNRQDIADLISKYL